MTKPSDGWRAELVAAAAYLECADGVSIRRPASVSMLSFSIAEWSRMTSRLENTTMTRETLALLSAVAGCHQQLTAHARRLRERKDVREVTHHLDMLVLDGGVRFEEFVDAELVCRDASAGASKQRSHRSRCPSKPTLGASTTKGRM